MQNHRLIPIITGLTVLFLMLAACEDDAKLKLIYENDFESGVIGPEWKNEGGDWQIVKGTLRSRRALNKDLVLNTPLPAEAVIQLDLISHSPHVDIKVRAWGDSRGDLHDGAYHFILGGWHNKYSIIAPQGEHDKRRISRSDPMKPNHWYKVKITRRAGMIKLFVDGKKFLSYSDTEPLDPAIFRHFSFANWETPCEFDNLKIFAYE